MSARLVRPLVLAIVLAGCSVGSPGTAYVSDPPSAVAGGLGAVFNSTPPYPGYPWTRDGRPVKPEELGTSAGPSYCGWHSATFLSIGWPVGTLSTSSAQARQFIRDPRGAVRASLMITLS